MRIDSLLKKTMHKSKRERGRQAQEGDIFGHTSSQKSEPVIPEQDVPLSAPVDDHQKESWTAVIDWYGPFETLGDCLEAAERLDEAGKPSFGFYMASTPGSRRSDAGDILFIGEHSRSAPKTLADTMEACPVIERVKNAAEFWIGLLASPRLDYSELDEVVTTRHCLTYALVPSIGSSNVAAPPYSFIVMNRYVGWDGKKDHNKFANLLPYAIEHWDKNDDYHGGVADTLFQWGNAESNQKQYVVPTILMGLVGLIGLGFAAWTYMSAPVTQGVDAPQPLLASLYSKSREVGQSYFRDASPAAQSLSAEASIEESVQVFDRLLTLAGGADVDEMLSEQTLPEVFTALGQAQGQLVAQQQQVAALSEQVEIKTAQLNSGAVELSRLSDELTRSEFEVARLQGESERSVALATEPETAPPLDLAPAVASTIAVPPAAAHTTAVTQSIRNPDEPDCLTADTGETVCIVTMEDVDHIVTLGQPIREVSDVTEATMENVPLDRQILGATGAMITTGTSGVGGLQ